MLEDDKAQELRKKAISEGYHVLDKNDLLYLESKSLNVHEQETIKIIYGLKQQDEMVNQTKKLANRTWWLTFATWFLALITLVYYLKK